MTTSESEPPCISGCQYIKPRSLQMLLLTILDVAEDNVFLSLWRCSSHQFQLSPSHSACIPNPLSPMEFSHASVASASADALPRRTNVRLAARSVLLIDCGCRRRRRIFWFRMWLMCLHKRQLWAHCADADFYRTKWNKRGSSSWDNPTSVCAWDRRRRAEMSIRAPGKVF